MTQTTRRMTWTVGLGVLILTAGVLPPHTAPRADEPTSQQLAAKAPATPRTELPEHVDLSFDAAKVIDEAKLNAEGRERQRRTPRTDRSDVRLSGIHKLEIDLYDNDMRPQGGTGLDTGAQTGAR